VQTFAALRHRFNVARSPGPALAGILIATFGVALPHTRRIR
jgi:hypothetical protein